MIRCAGMPFQHTSGINSCVGIVASTEKLHLTPGFHFLGITCCPERDNPEFIVAACNFCNTADNRFFDLAEKRGLKFDGMSPEELVAQRLPYVLATRESYKSFWDENVTASVPTD